MALHQPLSFHMPVLSLSMLSMDVTRRPPASRENVCAELGWKNVKEPVWPAGQTRPFVTVSCCPISPFLFPSPAYLGTKHHGGDSTQRNEHEIPVVPA